MAAASATGGRAAAAANARSLANPTALSSCIRHTDAQVQVIDEEGGLPMPSESRESPAKKRRPQPLLVTPREWFATHAQDYLRLAAADAAAEPVPNAWPDTAPPSFSSDPALRQHRGQAPPLA